MPRPFLILIVLDGFGCRAEREYNAIAAADTPRFASLYRDQPWTTLEASGLAVGLPEGQMGNSEVGHLNMGAGRVVDQDIVRISKAIAHHELQHNPTFISTPLPEAMPKAALELTGFIRCWTNSAMGTGF